MLLQTSNNKASKKRKEVDEVTLRKNKPYFTTTKNFPRAVVCGILRENYRVYSMTADIVQDKDYEAIIELFKERQKKAWNNRYYKYQHLWEYYLGNYLDYTQEVIYYKLKQDYETKQYPKHLKKNLIQALEKWKQ